MHFFSKKFAYIKKKQYLCIVIKKKQLLTTKKQRVMKKFIILVFNFDELQVNFVTVRPGQSIYSITYLSDFAYEFTSHLDAARAIEFLKCRHKNLRYEIIEKNCLNFK